MKLLGSQGLLPVAVELLALAPLVSSTCSNPIVRKEWRTLNMTERKSYISAVKCLQAKQPITRNLFEGVRSRYDDFVAAHINETDYVHFVMFRWHRYYVSQYETALRDECGWEGGQPYWDWTLDAEPEIFLNSPIFDNVTGFGGNGYYIDTANDTSVDIHVPGKLGGGCVKDGPFTNYTVHLGPNNSTAYNPRCMTRDIAPGFASAKLNSTMVEWTLSAENYLDFDIRAEGDVSVAGMTYHAGGHKGVGGDVGIIADLYASPSDPLFFLHHANMDRLWWTWQGVDPSTRLYQVQGPDTKFAYPFDFYGEVPYKNVTLAFEMHVGFYVPGGPEWVRIGEVMDTRGGKLCYVYDKAGL
ncbi:hypothetical protein IWZ00DRAFT_492292 [Phyllosticta capitalensis]